MFIGSISFSTTHYYPLIPDNGEGKKDERVGGEGEGKAGGKKFQVGGPSLLVVSGQGVDHCNFKPQTCLLLWSNISWWPPGK